jgi:hypothetical protein
LYWPLVVCSVGECKYTFSGKESYCLKTCTFHCTQHRMFLYMQSSLVTEAFSFQNMEGGWNITFVCVLTVVLYMSTWFLIGTRLLFSSKYQQASDYDSEIWLIRLTTYVRREGKERVREDLHLKYRGIDFFVCASIR